MMSQSQYGIAGAGSVYSQRLIEGTPLYDPYQTLVPSFAVSALPGEIHDNNGKNSVRSLLRFLWSEVSIRKYT